MLKFWTTLFFVASQLAAAQKFTAITVDTHQSTNPGSNAIDGNTSTFWHSEYSPVLTPLPHQAVLDLGSEASVNGFSYLPRQDGLLNGNIGRYGLEISTDKNTWKVVSNDTWLDDQSPKEVGFPSATIRYIRITAFTEAGNRGPWTSAAEFGVNIPSSPASGSTKGEWGPVIGFPIVPAGAFLAHDTGKVIAFAALAPNQYTGGSGNTFTATYDPSNGAVSELDVTYTRHDMFCPGMSLDGDGRAIVTGGSDADLTSAYRPSVDEWIELANMQIARGYQAQQTTCSDGRTFMIGGSWNGPVGGKNGEIYDGPANTWTLLPGCPVAPMLTNDQQGVYRADNHGWLFGWKNGYVFQAGPSSAMNWYGTSGTGSHSAAGKRGTDPDSMNGNAVMYDAVNGKILTIGGAPSYGPSTATSNAHIITIGNPNTTPTVQAIGNMHYARAFANGVVLPNGKVFITGGQLQAMPFTDTTAVFASEIWDPATEAFTVVASHAVPRTYHSVAILMLDGRVFTGGGGMCGDCATNHEDAQIYNPPYLFNTDGSLATRPVISAVSSAKFAVGSSFTATTNAANPSFVMIRYGSATHTVDTDQRRITLTSTSNNGAGTYTLKCPSDAGIVLPGYYMLFVLNGSGVPSVATTLQIGCASCTGNGS